MPSSINHENGQGVHVNAVSKNSFRDPEAIAAVHEAGHCVVAHYFGFRVTRCTLAYCKFVPEKSFQYSALLKVRGTDSYRMRQPWEAPAVRRWLMIDAAGHYAVGVVALMTEQPEVGGGGGKDYTDSIKLLVKLGADENKAHALLRQIARPTARLVSRLYSDICDLADTLLRRKTLAGDELKNALANIRHTRRGRRTS